MPNKTQLIGIVNLTPDSFSDGGRFSQPEMVLEAIAKMADDGAQVVDIGAESTRPGAILISPTEEWRRLSPVLMPLSRAKPKGVAISVDTRHAETARKALELGVDWINDVTGFVSSAMIDAVQHSSCRLVMMHSLGVPANKAITLPPALDPVATLLSWAKERASLLLQKGIAKERIIFDPGIGFGKTSAQSLAIIREMERFQSLEMPILVGHSRKSFLAQFAGANPALRDDATLAVSMYLVNKNTHYLRVHDVARHRQMLTLWNAITHDESQPAYRRIA